MTTTTNNDERSEKLVSAANPVEKDEELTALIDSLIKPMPVSMDNGCQGAAPDYLRYAFQEVAAFSAKKAREKAINEVIKSLPDAMEPCAPGTQEYGWNTCLGKIMEHLKSL